MAHRPSRTHLLGSAVFTAVLAACATPAPTPQALQLAGSAQTTGASPAAGEPEVITGSRIRSKTTDRLLKTTDAAGAREAERNRPPSAGPKFN